MPHSAIDSGVVDHIVTPDRIGFELRRLILFPNLATEIADWEEKPAELGHIFEMVKNKTRIDFSSYKLSTVLRRLQRRLVATRCEDLTAYLDFLHGHPEELEALARETLISVTEFFRDRDAFRALERQINAIVANKGPDDDIRVWSVGCATGEEAYSLAILFAEALGERLMRGKLQVFATDIDNDALAVARAGQYNAAALAEMPADYLAKYFQLSEKEGRIYEPTKGLRDCVVFARQDIAVDPPFLRMDLIVCRNVLIYFNTELQARVLSVLHYALTNDGLLFLGRSETVTQQEELFSVADRRNRLYRPRKDKRSALASRVVRGHLAKAPPPSLGSLSSAPGG
jgi:two-component system, chemotaxis family, CheB/CheR fusion protein